MEILKIENLSKVYGSGENAVRAVDGVSFGVEKGEFLAIIGPSGSGKSTLLHILGGVDRPTCGKLLMNGQDIYAQDEEALAVFRRRQVGLIYQFYNLIPVLNVVENMTLPVLMDGRQVNQERLEELLDVLGLRGREKHLPNQLSGGQQQRVAIARAVASSPKLLLLDEPLSNLDAKLRIDMRAELQRLHKELGTTIIYVTHDQTEALTMSTKIALFKAGELNQVATPTELYNNPIDLEAADFIGNPRINLLDGKAEVINGQLVVKSDLGGHTFPAEHLTSEEFPKSGEFDCVLAIRPEQIAISTQPVEGAIPVTIYANQPAGSETITTLKAGTDEFLAKDIGQIRYDLDQKVWAIIDQDKINIYNKETTRLIKRAV